MKISEIKYIRPDMSQMNAKLSELCESFDKAQNAAKQIEYYDEYVKIKKHFSTMSNLAYIRFTLDTRDTFYSGEIDFFNENEPLFEEKCVLFNSKMLTSKFRDQLEQILPNLLFKKYEAAQKCFSTAVISDMQEDNRLSTEYKKLLSSAQIPFRGELCNIEQLSKYKESPDRQTRKEAFDAHGKWMSEHSSQFDEIYDKMVKVRNRIAEKLGFKNYSEVAYLRMGRTCYTPEDVKKFAEAVEKYWVPFVSELKKAQQKTLGIENLMLYDDSVWLKNGNPEPIGSASEIFENGKKMYKSMSAITGEFIDFMLQNDLFDVLARPGKSCGGYQIDLPDYDMPFIFANFAGTYGDIDVLTHEAGHAIAAYVAERSIPFYELWEGGMETCEVHSMSMEFFAWRYMDTFFGQRADDYRKMHISNAISFPCYGVIVDRFQQYVYENPEMTPSERNELWLSLEKKYRPYLSSEGIEYFEKGTRWQYQGHIYENPFYYIDYCLAQTVALMFWVMMQTDYDSAFDKYMDFLKKGGTKDFVTLVSEGGLESPFCAQTLKDLSEKLAERLEMQ